MAAGSVQVTVDAVIEGDGAKPVCVTWPVFRFYR